MAALAVCPTGAVAEVYSCEIKEWVRVNDEGLVWPAPNAPFKRHVSIDKETGNAVGDALSVANRWEVAQKGSRENAFVTLGYESTDSGIIAAERAILKFLRGREANRQPISAASGTRKSCQTNEDHRRIGGNDPPRLEPARGLSAAGRQGDRL